MEVVMKVRDLLAGAALPGMVGSPEMGPLTEKGALQEARLNEIAFDVRADLGQNPDVPTGSPLPLAP
jgi:hypothetical protein